MKLLASPRQRCYALDFSFTFSFLIRSLITLGLLYFVVHYALGPFNSLFELVRGMNENVRSQFQGQLSLFSNGSTSKRNALILGGDERTFHIIISTVVLEGENQIVYQKAEFIF